MGTRIRVEITQQRADGDLLAAAVTLEYPVPWKNNMTGTIVDPLTETVMPAAKKAIAAGAAKPGDLVAAAHNIRQEVANALREYPPLSLEVWRMAAPDVRIISTW